MKIWVDADACPGGIKDIVVRAAERLKIATIFVANKDIRTVSSAVVSTIRVEKGADVADEYIVQNSELGDLVISQDIPLAALLIPKGVPVISLKGELFTLSNISERLSIRDFMQGVRDSGGITGGPAPFDNKIKQRFAATFDSTLTKLLREEKQRLIQKK